MKEVDREVLLKAIKDRLHTLNNTISAECSLRKQSLYEEWAGNGFAGSREFILFKLFTEIVTREYVTQLESDFKEIEGTNNKLSDEDFKLITDEYLAFCRNISSWIEQEFSTAPYDIQLWVSNFKKQIEKLITDAINHKSAISSIKKDDPALNTAKKANRIAIAAIIISVISVALSFLIK